MALLQLAAARLAGLDTVVYHTHISPEPVEEAAALLDHVPPEGSLRTFIEAVVAKKFVWGHSDGN